MEEVFGKENVEGIESILKDAEKNKMLIMISGGKSIFCGKGYELLSMFSTLIKGLRDLGIEDEDIRKAFDLGLKNIDELKEEAEKRIKELMDKLMNM